MHILPAIEREKRYIFPFLALLLLGLSLSFVTWQNLRQQKLAVEQHMVLAAKAIALGMEGNMGWRMRDRSRMGMGRSAARQFFQELLASPDVLFVGMFGPSGQMILSSDESNAFPAIPEEGLETLRDQRQWHVFSRFNGRDILLYVHQTRPIVARHFHEQFLAQEPPSRDQPSYLVLGLDMSEHLAMYQDARQAALWQTGYVLGTVMLLWVGALSLLRRREQGARVKELELFQSRLLDNLPDGLLSIDAEGIIRGANPSAITLLGGSDNLLGNKWSDIPLSRSLEHASPKNTADILWSQYSLADRHLEILVVPLRREEHAFGEHLVLVRDRTAIKKLEDNLQEAERLAGIGRLAAAVAHEIRNPLSALRGFAQFFAAKLKGQEPEETYARTMVAEADRLNRVITDLLFLAKPKPPLKNPVGLPDLFQEISTLMHPDLDQCNCAIRSCFSATEVWADADQIKQSLLNLVMNAIQAVPDNAGVVEVGSQPDRHGTWVFVQDNGAGMDGEQQRRALEPFYTTRKEGSGLGLAIVHKIIRDHGGRLEITSTLGAGTRVSLFFPNQE